MVERAWHKDPDKRPGFQEIVQVLDDQMKLILRTGQDSQLTDGSSGSKCCSIQ